MNLLVDLGNTRAKAYVDDVHGPVELANEANVAALLDVLERGQNSYHRVLVCSVINDAPWHDRLLRLAPQVVFLSASMPLPIRLNYDTPLTLGADRIAAVAGAWALQPGNAALVIDMGTAITYDVIDAAGCYQGGNIAPGLRLRLEALHEKTGRLPQVSPEKPVSLIGISTDTAILNGVMQGIRFEIEGYRRALSKKYRGILTFLTGGDAKFFEISAKSGIFVVPNLTAIGLSSIINH